MFSSRPEFGKPVQRGTKTCSRQENEGQRSKTQMICISASQDEVKSYMNVDGKRMLSGQSLKILGFTFGTRPNVNTHVNLMLMTLRRRLWIINHLKRSGMSTRGLKTIYGSMVRSVADFAAPAYHSLLTGIQTEAIERIQKKAVKTIYGHQYAYATILEHQDIQTLEQRRLDLVTKFAKKNADNSRFSSRWFPRADETGHDTRRKPIYKEFQARTERLRNSPLNLMRRILNSENE